jgi:osomolarity two-component system sensor histidine kinase SLN1
MSEKEDLPPPVQAGSSSTGRARFAAPPASSSPNRIRVHWARLRKRVGNGSQDTPSDSYGEDTLDGSSTWRRASDHPGSHQFAAWNVVGGQEGEPDEVDEVVVDNTFGGYGYGGEGSESHTGRTASEKPLEAGTSSHNQHTDKESTNTLSVWDRWVVLSIIRWRIIPGLLRFHSLAFADPKAESQYTREAW